MYMIHYQSSDKVETFFNFSWFFRPRRPRSCDLKKRFPETAKYFCPPNVYCSSKTCNMLKNM